MSTNPGPEVGSLDTSSALSYLDELYKRWQPTNTGNTSHDKKGKNKLKSDQKATILPESKFLLLDRLVETSIDLNSHFPTLGLDTVLSVVTVSYPDISVAVDVLTEMVEGESNNNSLESSPILAKTGDNERTEAKKVPETSTSPSRSTLSTASTLSTTSTLPQRKPPSSLPVSSSSTPSSTVSITKPNQQHLGQGISFRPAPSFGGIGAKSTPLKGWGCNLTDISTNVWPALNSSSSSSSSSSSTNVTPANPIIGSASRTLAAPSNVVYRRVQTGRSTVATASAPIKPPSSATAASNSSLCSVTGGWQSPPITVTARHPSNNNPNHNVNTSINNTNSSTKSINEMRSSSTLQNAFVPLRRTPSPLPPSASPQASPCSSRSSSPTPNPPQSVWSKGVSHMVDHLQFEKISVLFPHIDTAALRDAYDLIRIMYERDKTVNSPPLSDDIMYHRLSDIFNCTGNLKPINSETAPTALSSSLPHDGPMALVQKYKAEGWSNQSPPNNSSLPSSSSSHTPRVSSSSSSASNEDSNKTMNIAVGQQIAWCRCTCVGSVCNMTLDEVSDELIAAALSYSLFAVGPFEVDSHSITCPLYKGKKGKKKKGNNGRDNSNTSIEESEYETKARDDDSKSNKTSTDLATQSLYDAEVLRREVHAIAQKRNTLLRQAAQSSFRKQGALAAVQADQSRPLTQKLHEINLRAMLATFHAHNLPKIVTGRVETSGVGFERVLKGILGSRLLDLSDHSTSTSPSTEYGTSVNSSTVANEGKSGIFSDLSFNTDSLVGSRGRYRVDLHGLHSQEAVRMTEFILNAVVDGMTYDRVSSSNSRSGGPVSGIQRNSHRPSSLSVALVVGSGSHSKDGRERLRPAILNYLHQRGLRFVEDGPTVHVLGLRPK